MSEPLFIGIDIGTQGTKTVLCDINGKSIAESFSPSVLEHPEKNAITEDANKIFHSVISTIKNVMEKSGVDKSNVKSIGIDAQMAGIMGVDKNFNAITPLDSWLDNRCAKYTELINEKYCEESIRISGGQIINSHAPKILWWKNEKPDIYNNIAKFVMPNGFVAGKMCGLKSEDAFMDYTFIHFNSFSDNLNLCFNTEALNMFRIDADKLPRICKPTEIIDHLTKEYAVACGLSTDTLVIAGCGDTAASSLGAGITKNGLAYDVAGTASVFACCTDKFAPDVKNKTLMFSRSVVDGLFLPLAFIIGGGMRLRWFSELVGKDLKTLDKMAACVEEGACGVRFNPHFSGRACPFDNSVTGNFTGLYDNVGAAEMYRAILEGIALEYKIYIDIMQESDCIANTSAIRGVGGGAKSPIFAKIKADILALDYIPLEHICSASQAVAKLAAYSTGYTNKSLSALFNVNETKKIHFENKIHEKYIQIFS